MQVITTFLLLMATSASDQAATPTTSPASAATATSTAKVTNAPNMTGDGLQAICFQFPGANCCKGTPNELLMQIARDGAYRQAMMGQCGHPNVNQHSQQLTSRGFQYNEIACESYPGQQGFNAYQVAQVMFDGWRHSPEHWAVASRYHRYWGGAIRYSNNGRWYATICTAD